MTMIASECRYNYCAATRIAMCVFFPLRSFSCRFCFDDSRFFSNFDSLSRQTPTLLLNAQLTKIYCHLKSPLFEWTTNKMKINHHIKITSGWTDWEVRNDYMMKFWMKLSKNKRHLNLFFVHFEKWRKHTYTTKFLQLLPQPFHSIEWNPFSEVFLVYIFGLVFRWPW